MIQSGSMSAGGRSSICFRSVVFVLLLPSASMLLTSLFLIGMIYENPEIRGIFLKKGRKKNTA